MHFHLFHQCYYVLQHRTCTACWDEKNIFLQQFFRYTLWYRAKVKKPYIYEYFRVCISLYVCLSPESDQVTIESLEIGVVHARVLSLESTMYCLEL